MRAARGAVDQICPTPFETIMSILLIASIVGVLAAIATPFVFAALRPYPVRRASEERDR